MEMYVGKSHSIEKGAKICQSPEFKVSKMQQKCLVTESINEELDTFYCTYTNFENSTLYR